MTLKDLVLTGFLTIPCLASCVTETTRTTTVSIEPYFIGISGYMEKNILEYENKKVEIITLTNKTGKYCLVFAPKSSNLLHALYKDYGIHKEIIFITNNNIEKVSLN